MLELPITSDPAQEFTLQLGDLSARVNVLYNSVSGVWTLSLADNITETPILEGAALVLGVDLLSALSLNYGTLLCVDYTGKGVEATLDSITSKVGVVWFPPDEG